MGIVSHQLNRLARVHDAKKHGAVRGTNDRAVISVYKVYIYVQNTGAGPVVPVV